MANDVLIVGAGIAGMLSALALQRRGRTVAVLDDAVARPPASWAAGGILSTLPPWQGSPAVYDLTRHAADEYRTLAAEIRAAGGEDPALLPGGMLVLGQDPAPALEWAAEQGVAVERCRAGSRFPWLGDTPGLWLADVMTVRNPRLLKGLRQLLAHRGVTVQQDRALALDAGAGMVRVQGERGRYDADQVLVCAGAWTSALLPGLALRAFPARGQMLLLRPVEPMPAGVLLGPGGYLVARADGLVLAGSTVEPDQWDGRPTAQAHQQLLAMACRLWPALSQASVLAQWTGLRPALEREAPVIAPLPGAAGRIWLNTGHFRNGLVCAPGSARLVAALMCGDTPMLDPAPYSVSVSSSSSSP